MKVDPLDVLNRVNDHHKNIVEFTKMLVRTESPSTDLEAQRRIQAIITSGLEGVGYEVTRIRAKSTGGHLYAVPRRRKHGNLFQLILGHCDTVWPMGTLRQMPARHADGRLTGPGVFDMKAGLAQIVYALKVLQEAGVEPALTPVILITSDEEIGSPDSRPHIEMLARRAERALIVEPASGTSGKLKTARKGTGHFDITISGKAAHAGLSPHEGASAIHELSHVVQKLFDLSDPERGVTVNVGTIGGGLRSNVVAPHGEAGVDVRVLHENDGERIAEAIQNLTPTIPGVSIEVTGGIDRGPMEPTPRNQALWRMAKKIGLGLGLELEQTTSGGASDGNITSRLTATLDGLGAVGDGAHAHHEYVDVYRTMERCALLALILIAPSVGVESEN